jgi:PAS domain-containing protein
MWQQVSSVLNMSMEEIRASRNVLVNVFDPQHRVLFWNRKCEEVFGVLEKDALGKRLEEIVPHAQGTTNWCILKGPLPASGSHPER